MARVIQNFIPAIFLLAVQCSPPTPLSLQGPTMGTYYRIKYFPSSETPDPLQLNKAVLKSLNEINRQMSTYQKDSEITAFNRHKSSDWFSVSPLFFTTLKKSLEIAQKTNGSFDPTIAPLVNLWGFGPRGKREIPSPSAVKSAQKKVGFKKIKLMPPQKIKKDHPQTILDLSACAKGLAVDEVAKLLESYGIKNYLVEIGGEIKIKGAKGKNNWHVAIESPRQDNLNLTLSLQGDFSLATSGDYRNFFKKNSKKYTHIIDPLLGAPVQNDISSVTVISKSCLQADCLSTALMLMGVKKGFLFAEKEGIMAHFIYRTPSNKLQTKSTPAFKQFIKKP